MGALLSLHSRVGKGGEDESILLPFLLFLFRALFIPFSVRDSAKTWP